MHGSSVSDGAAFTVVLKNRGYGRPGIAERPEMGLQMKQIREEREVAAPRPLAGPGKLPPIQLLRWETDPTKVSGCFTGEADKPQ